MGSFFFLWINVYWYEGLGPFLCHDVILLPTATSNHNLIPWSVPSNAYKLCNPTLLFVIIISYNIPALTTSTTIFSSFQSCPQTSWCFTGDNTVDFSLFPFATGSVLSRKFHWDFSNELHSLPLNLLIHNNSYPRFVVLFQITQKIPAVCIILVFHHHHRQSGPKFGLNSGSFIF